MTDIMINIVIGRCYVMEKKNLLTYEGLQKLETELQDLKVVKRKE